MVAGAVAAGAGLVVLTEMFATGFSMDAERIAEPEGRPDARRGSPEQAAPTACGCAARCPSARPGAAAPQRGVLAGPDGTTHRYAKIHPFTYAGEHEHYAAGDGTVTVDVEGSGSASSSATTCASPTTSGRWPRPPTSTSCWPTGPRPAAPTGRRCSRPGPSRTRPTWSASTGSARAAASTYAGDSRIFDPLGEMLAGGGPDRDDPPRRRRRGRGGQGARPLPVPARPPHRRALGPTPPHTARGHDARYHNSGQPIAPPCGNPLTGTG